MIIYLISILVSGIIYPFGFIAGLIGYLKKNGNKRYLVHIASSKSQHMNVVMAPLFNKIMIKENGYQFGSMDEQISSVLGKNKLTGTLKGFGKLICKILGDEHLKKAIE